MSDTPRTAKQRYDEFTAGETLSPIEALRFFCSCAMNGDDWLDVEPLFDAITRERDEAVAALRDAAEMIKKCDYVPARSLILVFLAAHDKKEGVMK